MLWRGEKNNVSSLLVERPRKAEEVKSLIKLYEVWDLLHENEFHFPVAPTAPKEKWKPKQASLPM